MRYLFLFTIILFVLTGFIMMNSQKEYCPSKGEKLINSILAKTALFIQKEYNIKPCGTGAAMPGGPIQEVTLCFDTKYPYSQEQLRDLLVKSAQSLLDQVNDNKEIQEFLNEKPFTIKMLR